MPGYSDYLNDFRGSGAQPLDLGKAIGGFIDSALPDFTHLTVLMFLVRNAKTPCTAGAIADETGDSKRTVQAVLERFEKHGMVRSVPAFLSKKYALNREGAGMEVVGRLAKLWDHPQSHEAILRRVLAPKAPRP